MSDKFDKLFKKQQQIVELLSETNGKLEKVCALLVSNQILQESVSAEGEVRSPEECGVLVKNAFNAGLCLSLDLEEDRKLFEYSVSEFYVQDQNPLPKEEDEDDNPPQDNRLGVSPIF